MHLLISQGCLLSLQDSLHLTCSEPDASVLAPSSPKFIHHLPRCAPSSPNLGYLYVVITGPRDAVVYLLPKFLSHLCFAVNSVRFSSKHFSFIFKSPLLWLKMNVKISISGRIILNLLKVMWWLPTDQAKIIEKKRKEKYTQRVHNRHLVVCPFLHLANIYPAFAVHGQDLRRLTHLWA